MTKFQGFNEKNPRSTSIYDQFFNEVLPIIDSLAELKLVLYFFWRLDRIEGVFRYLRRADILSDNNFMASMINDDHKPETILNRALEGAVNHEILLKGTISLENRDETLFFLNTPKNKAAVLSIQKGEWQFSGDVEKPIVWLGEIPNIYRLYEEHIGPLAPMIVEALKDAEDNFPVTWIEDAIRIAVENNKRNWRYIEAILDRWQREGRDDREDKKDSEKNGRRYIEGKYADWIEH